jgi:alpha-L-fucosidase
MKKRIFAIALFSLILVACGVQPPKYTADRESLRQVNPVPEWFKDAKFGIYFHWGVYSVPAFANEWYPRNMYGENSRENLHHIENYGHPDEWPFHYFITGAEDKHGNFKQFAPRLKSEGGNFDPQEWADLFAAAGARFAGPVAEHHDGFSMWASDVNPWNARDKGPGIDLVGVLTDAFRESGMKIILSMHHAYNITGFYENVPQMDDPDLQMLYGQMGRERNEEVWLEKHREIIDKYRPDIIWQDFNLPALSEEVLLEFLAYYYNRAEEWGKEVVTTYKDALDHDIAVLDYERGGPVDLTGYYWLTDDAISRTSWCYTEGINYYRPIEVLHGFFDRISKNGNLLLNISPRADGSIPAEQKEILLFMGDWLGKYGEAVYETRAWERFGEGPTQMGAGHPHGEGVQFIPPRAGTPEDIRFTRSKDNTVLYAILLGWPEVGNTVSVTTLAEGKFSIDGLDGVSLLGSGKGEYIKAGYYHDIEALHVELPGRPAEEPAYVLKLSFPGGIPAVAVD